ncbi:MAG TPA: DUF2505 family protein [Acidimicrobiia bacterium]|nr:DUF2505 family protein [Acidimicrobiia bacterium]
MRFRAEHTFSARPRAVAEVLCDPAFHLSLDLPDLGAPDLVEESRDGARHRLRLRYEFVGHLDPVAQRILAGRRLTWIQELRLDLQSGTGELKFEGEAEPGRLFGAAQVTIVPDGADHARRRIDGEFSVKVPLIGGTAERRIVPGLVRRLDVEADALEKVLARGG